ERGQRQPGDDRPSIHRSSAWPVGTAPAPPSATIWRRAPRAQKTYFSVNCILPNAPAGTGDPAEIATRRTWNPPTQRIGTPSDLGLPFLIFASSIIFYDRLSCQRDGPVLVWGHQTASMPLWLDLIFKGRGIAVYWKEHPC